MATHASISVRILAFAAESAPRSEVTSVPSGRYSEAVPRRPTVSMILHATSEIVSHDGVASLTLDAVAHRAGISKGGLLYHFPSKGALLSALILHQLDEFEADLERRAAVLPDGPGRWLCAYVEATFDPSQMLGPDLVGALMRSEERRVGKECVP